MWIISPGDTSIPAIETGTLTACTAIPPCPGEIPLNRYWNSIGRISSMSREGPFEIAPKHPTDFIAAVMFPPANPTLFANSGGNFCCNARIVGFLDACRASITSMKESSEKPGSGKP